MSLKPYLQSLWTAFSKIDVNSERGELAYNMLYAGRRRGICPKTGLPIELKVQFESYGKEMKSWGKQVIAFYWPLPFSDAVSRHAGYWISTNSGRSWMITPNEKVFLKIIDKIDVII